MTYQNMGKKVPQNRLPYAIPFQTDDPCLGSQVLDSTIVESGCGLILFGSVELMMQMDCQSIGKRIPLVEANQFQLIAANAVPAACHPMPWPAACAKYSVALSTPLEL